MYIYVVQQSVVCNCGFRIWKNKCGARKKCLPRLQRNLVDWPYIFIRSESHMQALKVQRQQMLLASPNGLLKMMNTHSAWYRRGEAAMVIHACVGQLIVLGVGETHEWEVITGESLQ